MKRLGLFFFLAVFFFSCNEKEPIISAKTNGDNQRLLILDGVTLQGNILIFEDENTFKKTIQSNSSIELLERNSRIKGFQSLNQFYNKLTDNDLSSIFESKTIPSKYVKYLKLVKDGEDIVLSSTVPENFLRIISNQDLQFIIQNDRYTVLENSLKIEKNYDSNSSKQIQSDIQRNFVNSKSRPNSIHDDSDNAYYTWDDNDYRIKFNSWTTNASSSLWNTVQFEIVHQKKNFGIYWNKDAQELQISGSFYGYNNNPGLSVQSVNLYNSNHHANGGIYGGIVWYDFSGRCKGNDGLNRYVGVSEYH